MKVFRGLVIIASKVFVTIQSSKTLLATTTTLHNARTVMQKNVLKTHLRSQGRENRGEIVLIFYIARANAVIMWRSDKHED